MFYATKKQILKCNCKDCRKRRRQLKDNKNKLEGYIEFDGQR